MDTVTYGPVGKAGMTGFYGDLLGILSTRWLFSLFHYFDCFTQIKFHLQFGGTDRWNVGKQRREQTVWVEWTDRFVCMNKLRFHRHVLRLRHICKVFLMSCNIIRKIGKVQLLLEGASIRTMCAIRSCIFSGSQLGVRNSVSKSLVCCS